MSLTIKEKFKTIIKLVAEPKVFYTLMSFRSFGYLSETGWFNSFKSGEPVDANQSPIPWFTYSAIDFINDNLSPSCNAFEFGSGNSTLFFANRIKRVTSVEHNFDWFEKIKILTPKNAKLVYTSAETIENYLNPLINTSDKFDLIIIDGLFRNECIEVSLKHLSEEGVIILDDSERKEYKEGVTILLNNGFKRLDFSGIAPGVFFRKCTTFFYRERNVFNI
jgi:hypothetical protein